MSSVPGTHSAFHRVVAGVAATAVLVLVDRVSARPWRVGEPFTILSKHDGGLPYPSLDEDAGTGIVVDATGAIYVIGYTSSPDFPTTAHAFQRTLRGGATLGTDVFVLKLDASGHLVYSTYLGGCEDDFASAIAVDAVGNAYIGGITGSADFPTVNAMPPGNTNAGSAFVAKLDPMGAVAFSTYLPGRTSVRDLTLDASGSVYLTGATTSPGFPAARTACRPEGDVLVAQLSPTGSLVWATCLGGSQSDEASAIAVDPTGVYVAGSTWSADFPTTPGALQPGIRRSEESTRNGFIAKLDLGGSHLVYATFLPMERVGGIAIDHAGAAYVSGGVTPWTATIFTPTPGAFQPTPGSDSDAVIVKLDPEVRRLVYATYLGGSELDGGGRIAVDAGGAAYVTGETQSPDFPVTPTAPRRRSVLFDTFAAKLDPTGGALLYATYLGCDSVSGMALGPGDVASVTGATFLDDLATTPGAFQSTRDSIDGYVLTLSADGTHFIYGTFLGAGGPMLLDPVSQLPNGPALDCETRAASALGRLARAVVRCHVQLARAAAGRRPDDDAACEAKARARYDAAVTKLAGCPACEAASQADAADALEARLRAANAEFYRAGTRVLGGGLTGFVADKRRVLRCENVLARGGAALFQAGLGCQGQRASGAPACPGTVGYRFRVGHCPRCLQAALRAVAYRADALVRELAGKMFCAGTPLPSAP